MLIVIMNKYVNALMQHKKDYLGLWLKKNTC